MNRKYIVIALSLLGPVIAGCGNGNTTADMGVADMTAQPDMMQPPAPAIGEQIDRMGRPGVNTALTDPFDLMGMKNQIRDAYNKGGDPTMWVSQNMMNIRKNLAILDGLDTVCGNQIAADAAVMAGGKRYDFLATVLATDILFVDTTKTTCKLYLGVEAAALGIQNSDCGGRTPPEDVIDETYSLLAIGAPSGVDDGVPKDDSPNPGNDNAFPFLGAPQ
jgi:hypothetical protein